MTRSRPLLTLAASLVLCSGWLTAVPAYAAATYTQLSLSATVSGATVSATTTVKANASTLVDRYGVCVRNSSGAGYDFPLAKSTTITTAGTDNSSSQNLPAGNYRFFSCLRVGGSWSEVGPRKTFTVASTTPTPPPGILFEDDFTGAAGQVPDPSKWGEWSACTYNGSAAYGNIKCGARSTLDGAGHLSIPATPDTGTSISTKDDFSFTYGTITARMKVPTQVGYWPAFWTLNNNPSGNPNSAIVGEADVMEAYTTFSDGYRRAVHNYSDQGWSSGDDPICGNGHVLGEWHDYSAKIEPNQITFYFDGQQCGQVATKGEGQGKPYAFGPDLTRGNWLLLTLAIGGAGGQQKPATEQAVLLVDRVEVRAL